MKLLVPLLMVGGALSYLITAGLGKSVLPYMTAEEFLAAGRPGHALRLTGYVVSGTLARSADGLAVDFSLGMNEAAAERNVRVSFHGTIPDTLKDGSEVVAEGQFADGTFTAVNLLAKCPSRYEADLEGKAHEGEGAPPHGEAAAGDPEPASP
jgi:cytochrome c-type biogenesis protein CcmE